MDEPDILKEALTTTNLKNLTVKQLVLLSTKEARSLLNYAEAKEMKCLPISSVKLRAKDCLIVACQKSSEDQKKLIKFLTQKEPLLVECDPLILEQAIFSAYHQESNYLETKIIDLKKTYEQDTTPKINNTNQLRDINSVENSFLCSLLDYCVAWNASDLHLKLEEGGMSISVRVNGELMSRNTQIKNNCLYERVVRRIKILANLDVTNTDKIQEGAFEIPLSYGSVFARVSLVKALEGESVAIRLLKKSGEYFLSNLGLKPEVEHHIRDLLSLENGAIITCGATGAGKTTTLYAITKELIARNKRVISIEDPVEVKISGMTQIQVNEHKKISFASGLKAILRQDPDVIFIGEVRDQEVAQIMIKGALSGHLVLTSMHAGSIKEAKARIGQWGISKSEIELGVRAFIYQKLIRAEETISLEVKIS